jgi:hypothetical protein
VLCGCSLFSDLDRFEQAPATPDGGRDASASQDASAPSDSGDDDDGGVVDAGMTDAGQDEGGMADAGMTDGGPVDLGCANPRTLCVRIDRFSPHVQELVSFDLVTVRDNILRARAIIEPLDRVRADFVLPLAIPAREVPTGDAMHPLHLKLWADDNRDGEYTEGGADHEWNLDLPASGNLTFVHDSEFNSIAPLPRPIGADFQMQFVDMQPHIGQLLEVMVIEVDSGRTVGLHRTPSVTSGDFEITIPGIIDPGGNVYRIEFYADFNGNGTYDDPPVDHAWVRIVESGRTGVQLSFAHGTEFAALEYQFDFEP